MKSSTFSRSLELAKLVTQVGIKELRSGDIKSRYEQAVLIAKSLSQLKGAAMKAGQLLSLDLDNYFPPEAIEVLSQLQNAAVAQPYSKIISRIEKELSAEKRTLIADISREPLGVASIGQVHKASYMGKPIVLKVQYEEVDSSIESDLKILKTLATSFCQITGRKMNLDPLFKEFQTLLEQELNYTKEAEFQTEFAEKVKILSQQGPVRYRVPQVIPALSSKKVLAMSYEKGQTLRQWLNSKPSSEDRKSVAIAVLDLYFQEFFNWGLVQTDPNWGNFLIHKNQDHLEICLLDFGASRRYSPEFIEKYISLLEFASQGQKAELRELAIGMGLIDPRESQAAFVAFDNMLKTAIKPFFADQQGRNLFDFSSAIHTQESQETVRALSRELIYSPPPYSIVFLHRKLGGVYSILKSLNVQLDVSPYWQMMREFSTKKV